MGSGGVNSLASELTHGEVFPVNICRFKVVGEGVDLDVNLMTEVVTTEFATITFAAKGAEDGPNLDFIVGFNPKVFEVSVHKDELWFFISIDKSDVTISAPFCFHLDDLALD